MNIVLNELSESEVLRYLGCPPDDERTRSLMRSCADTFLSAIQPRAVWRVFDCTVWEDGVRIGEHALFLPGRDLAAVLSGCTRAVLFCATLGASVDALLRREQLSDMARAIVMDSCATAAVEAVCDKAEQEIRTEYPGLYLTARYSPGYGDVPVSVQHDFLRLLDAPRRIGLCTTDTCMLTPRKSVTAVIGLSDKPVKKPKKSCDSCRLHERCAFYKKEEHCGLSQTD